jgi:HlyD family secretion protein
VNINFAKHENVLLVPNAALRYKPKNEEMKLAAKKDKKSDQNKSKTKSDGLGSGKIYVLRNNKPEMIRVKTSITNGKFTEIITSDIKPNEFVITADMGNDQKSGSNSQGPQRPPRVF